MTGEKAGYTAALNGLSITEKPRAGKKMACSLRQGGVYDILGPAKHREVPGAALRLAGRIGKQVQSLCGTAAVRRAAPAKDVTVSMTREGWPGRGVLSAPTFQAGRPALRLILHAAPCLSGRREGRTRAADGPNAGAEKRLAAAVAAGPIKRCF